MWLLLKHWRDLISRSLTRHILQRPPRAAGGTALFQEPEPTAEWRNSHHREAHAGPETREHRETDSGGQAGRRIEARIDQNDRLPVNRGSQVLRAAAPFPLQSREGSPVGADICLTLRRSEQGPARCLARWEHPNTPILLERIAFYPEPFTENTLFPRQCWRHSNLLFYWKNIEFKL